MASSRSVRPKTFGSLHRIRLGQTTSDRAEQHDGTIGVTPMKRRLDGVQCNDRFVVPCTRPRIEPGGHSRSGSYAHSSRRQLCQHIYRTSRMRSLRCQSGTMTNDVGTLRRRSAAGRIRVNRPARSSSARSLSGYLVLMAFGTMAYGMLAGLSASVAFLFLVMGLWRGWRVSAELTIGLAALAASGQILATLALHTADTTADYEAILHGPFTYLGIATLVAITWTVGVTEDLWFPRLPLAITGFGMIAIALNALTPGALIADDVTGLRQVRLFGEAFVVHTPAHASLGLVLLALLVSITGYIGAAMMARWRTGKRLADPLSLGIAVAWLDQHVRPARRRSGCRYELPCAVRLGRSRRWARHSSTRQRLQRPSAG